MTLDRESISEPLVRCYCTFVECSVALAHAWVDGPGRIDSGRLEWMATNLLSTYDILLRTPKSKAAILTTV